MLEENTTGSLKQNGGHDRVWGQREGQCISESVERLRAHRASPSRAKKTIASFTAIGQMPGRHPPGLHIPVGLL